MYNSEHKSKNSPVEVSLAISAHALLSKSKLYASRALQAKVSKEPEVYQIWAALALELLGKAQLASIHPCLVVEPDNPNSLLEACGIETDTKVKTVSANVVFARLKHTVPKFGTPNSEACNRISSRRNVELHSGQAAFVGVEDTTWEGQFWSTAQLVLSSMNLELEDWVSSDSKIPENLARDFSSIKIEAAKQKIENAKIGFEKIGNKKQSKKQLDELRKSSQSFRYVTYLDNFRYSLDSYWDEPCPACGCRGFLGGDRIHEEVVNYDFSNGYETVLREFSPAEFYCPSCDLHLDGAEELMAADLNQQYTDEIDRDIEYEPDYGND